MDRLILLMLAGIIAGFVLVKAPLSGSFLASIEPITSTIGILAILVFSLYLIYKGLMAIFRGSNTIFLYKGDPILGFNTW